MSGKGRSGGLFYLLQAPLVEQRPSRPDRPAIRSIVDNLGFAPSGRSGARQELRGLVAGLAALARGRALGRVAAELGLQFHQVGEDIGLAAELIGNHQA